MRKKIVAGNWKMNLTYSEAMNLAAEVQKELSMKTPDAVQLILCPPFPFIKSIADGLDKKLPISLGAQNCASEKSGAYTGEVSASMIESLGANYCILGHSERRALYFETDEVLVKKLNLVLSNTLIPIFCCGESLAERESGKHFEIIEKQLENGLFHLDQLSFSKVIIAYEPVWAIGTGVTASSTQAQEIHLFIRKLLAGKFGETASQNCSLLYGGSCNPGNAAELFSMPDVDGGLIGGAALKAKDFVVIANSF